MEADQGHHSHVWLTVSGTVYRLLPDEFGRLQHQRFLIRCSSGLSLLIVNDVSIGQRVPVKVATSVTVHGEYIWNDLGGLIHFTHHALYGGPSGWIVYRGREYAWISFRKKKWITSAASGDPVEALFTGTRVAARAHT